MMRRVNVFAYLCLCTAAFCRVSSFDASWDERIKDDHEISPYSEYQKTLWYRKPRYSGSSARNYGNLGLVGSSASRIQGYSQLRSIDPYSSNLGYTSYSRPARSRDTSYFYSPASSALEDEPYGNLNSFSGRPLREMNHYASMGPSSTGLNDRKLHDENPYARSDSRISRLYEMDSIQDPYQSKGYKIQEDYKIQPQTGGRKLYVVPRGDQKRSEPYLGDDDFYDGISRMENFKTDKEVEDVPFRNSDIVYTPEVKHNHYNLPIDLHHMNLPSVNFGNRDINSGKLRKIDKRNDDDLSLAEMSRISKVNQERDFTLADDVTFGEIQKREYPDEVIVADDNAEDDEEVIEDIPDVAFEEDFSPARQEIMVVESKEDFNGKLSEDESDDVLEGDVVLEETMEEDGQEGRIARASSGTANEAPLKNDDSKLIENSSIAEVPVKEKENKQKKIN